jgi:CHAT domain-containing protein
LSINEVVDLDIKADFVSLSACQTGLGKLYSGEGVVGLTQAFLIAGANGLSVSLWSVADESTAQFMVALYKLAEDPSTSLRTGGGIGYAEAMTEVKRRFINGDFGEKWQAPYYWAPFVYYGN